MTSTRNGALWFAIFVVGCARSTCEVAQDRLAECAEEVEATANAQGYVRVPLSLSSCSGPVNECVASCVADSHCPAINWVVLGKKGDPSAPIPPGAWEFEGCLNQCMEL